jgi:hypothetical protein
VEDPQQLALELYPNPDPQTGEIWVRMPREHGSSENLMNRVQALARWQSELSSCRSVQHTLSQQVELSSPVHRTLDELELVYPALGLSLAVGL